MSKQVSEELLYALITSNIESLQKAGYHLLRHIYVNSLPTLQYPAEDKWDPAAFMSDKEGEELKTPLQSGKYEDLSKNIPLVLLEMIERAPNVLAQSQDPLSDTKRTAASVDSILATAEEPEDSEVEEVAERSEYLLPPEMYGYLLCWNGLLHKVYYGWLHCRKAKNDDYLAVLNSISVYLNNNKAQYEMFLLYLSAFLPSSQHLLAAIKQEDLIGFDPAAVSLHSGKDVGRLSLYCLFNFMKNYPTLARSFYTQCDPTIAKVIAVVVTKVISPTIWFAEATNLHNCQVLPSFDS